MATPNMNLVEIVPGVTAGPQYATDIVSNFSTIDAHDHTAGNGSLVPVAGLNINADLPFGGFGASGLGRSQYNSLAAALSGTSNYRSVHVVSGELYYLDNAGNAVQITNSGAVAAAAGNITGLSAPATVTFSTNKYVFKDTADSFAKMESADIRLFEDAAGVISNYVALISPSSLAATYTITMPSAVPATSLEYLSMTSAGVVEPVTSNELVETVARASATTVGSLGVARSVSSGNFSTTSATLVDVTNMSVTITTGGRPVFLAIVDDSDTANASSISLTDTPSTAETANIAFIRGATQLTNTRFGVTVGSSTGALGATIPGTLTHVDVVAAGTYTYKVQVHRGTSAQINVSYMRLVAFEL